MERRLTIGEWSKIYDLDIIDPDGFDRTDALLWTRPFTEAEFVRGMLWSSISKPRGAFFEKAGDPR